MPNGVLSPTRSINLRPLAAARVGQTLVAYDAGDTVPVDGTSGFAPSCQFLDTSASTIDARVFINGGTAISCNFDALNLTKA